MSTYSTRKMSGKPTTIKEALAKWEEKSGETVKDAKIVKLFCQLPPIDKMDNALSALSCCEKLSLSTNSIEKIANLNGLKHLKILSLGRNNIKMLTGLDVVGDTLEELWISYNLIEKLKGVNVLRKLKILHMSNNQVKDWNEFTKLNELPYLEDLVFIGNPLHESEELTEFTNSVAKKLPRLKKLDGIPVIRDEDDEDE